MLKKYGMLLFVGLLLLGAIGASVLGEREKKAQSVETAAQEPTIAVAAPVEESVDYFSAFRTERETVRDKEKEYLDEIIATGAGDDETLAEAVERKLALVENMEAELSIESLIVAKGFKDAAVTFHNGAVNVVVDAQQLSEAQAAQILDIVQREAGVKASAVRITAAQ